MTSTILLWRETKGLAKRSSDVTRRISASQGLVHSTFQTILDTVYPGGTQVKSFEHPRHECGKFSTVFDTFGRNYKSHAIH